MTTTLRLAALALVLALPGLAAAQSADAVTSSSTRVLADGVLTLKGNDGVRVTQRSTMTYDPVAGEYIRLVTDVASGAVIERSVLKNIMVRPTEAEERVAQSLIRNDAELSALIGASEHEVVVEGGFPLVREAGHACGPGSRCLQYDVYQLIPDQLAAERIRYVVVNLQDLTLFSNDFDVVNEGNLANPAAARSGVSR